MFRTVTLLQKHRKPAQAAMEAVQAVGTGLQAYLITARFTFIFEISLSLKFAIFFRRRVMVLMMVISMWMKNTWRKRIWMRLGA